MIPTGGGRRTAARPRTGSPAVLPPATAADSRDGGMVTVELALAIPMVLVMAVAALWLLALGQMQAQLTDAARATARDLARGGSVGQALDRGHQVDPRADLRVVSDGAEVEVAATRTLTGPGPMLGRLERTLRVTVRTAGEVP